MLNLYFATTEQSNLYIMIFQIEINVNVDILK